MSASSRPTRWPMVASPMARLIAVVDLPTPPLPEATAMIAFTPGDQRSLRLALPAAEGRRRPRRGPAAWRSLGREHGAAGQDAGQGPYRLLARLAQRFQARRLRRVDLDRESDVAVLDGHAGNHAETDHVLIAVRVADPAQGGKHLLGGELVHG